MRYHPTAWGGRIGRYATHRGAENRCFDPFDGKDVVFAKEYEYEAWVHQRFSASTLQISHSTVQVHACVNGRDVRAETTFEVIDRLGKKHYHLVRRSKTCKGTVARLRAIASHHGATLVVTDLAQLRQEVALFWRLELLRQACELHEGEGSALDGLIVEAARLGTSSRNAMHQRFSQVECQLVDARLAHLHHCARIRLLLDRDDFGVLPVHGGAA